MQNKNLMATLWTVYTDLVVLTTYTLKGWLSSQRWKQCTRILKILGTVEAHQFCESLLCWSIYRNMEVWGHAVMWLSWPPIWHPLYFHGSVCSEACICYYLSSSHKSIFIKMVVCVHSVDLQTWAQQQMVLTGRHHTWYSSIALYPGSSPFRKTGYPAPHSFSAQGGAWVRG